MLLTNLLLGGLDYNIAEKGRIINSNFLIPNLIEEIVTHEESDSFIETKNIYLFEFKGIRDVYQNISTILKEEFENGSISSDVYKTSFDLVSLLPESVLIKLEEENIYPTNYGTIVFDWEDSNSNDEFSLEIGNSCFGYFSEFNGKDTINVEEVEFHSQEVNILHERIEKFYQR